MRHVRAAVLLFVLLTLGVVPVTGAGAYVNNPPAGGTFEVDPTIGVAMHTIFHSSAEGWVDPEGDDVLYQWKYRVVGEPEIVALTGFSYHPWASLILPEGELELIVVISDVYGAKTSASVFVTALPPTPVSVGVEPFECLWTGGQSMTGVTVTIDPEAGATVEIMLAEQPYMAIDVSGSVDLAPGPYSWFAYPGAGYSLTGTTTGEFTLSGCSPPVLINDLIDQVAVLNLENGISNALDAKLANAIKALEDVNANNDAAAINKLQAFMNEVDAQAGTKINQTAADALRAAAQHIIDIITANT